MFERNGVFLSILVSIGLTGVPRSPQAPSSVGDLTVVAPRTHRFYGETVAVAGFPRLSKLLNPKGGVTVTAKHSELVYFPWQGFRETCIPLELVGEQGSSITKTVTLPSLGITRSNWNTDWSVPANRQFKRFEATIASEKTNSYKISLYLKYSDGTASEFYSNDEVQIMARTPLQIEATPRAKEQPYQVNLVIGGLKATGQTYTANVLGCY